MMMMMMMMMDVQCDKMVMVVCRTKLTTFAAIEDDVAKSRKKSATFRVWDKVTEGNIYTYFWRYPNSFQHNVG